ncbi:hypothetical protein MKW92_040337 [Papaver armeniacum]|nr:hypothetical protein MKW92_040337 [Papaver armeniacum]
MPKIKTNRVRYPEGCELIEPTLRELEAKMRQDFYMFLNKQNDPHDGKKKCEALWPIFNIAHQKSQYIYDLFLQKEGYFQGAV